MYRFAPLLYCFLLIWPALSYGQAAADCAKAEDLGSACTPYASGLAPAACLRPGAIFVRKQQWELASRTTITYADQQRLEFFYVADARSATDSYRVLFVGIDRRFGERRDTRVKLTQNREFGFKKFEEKDHYSAALKGRPLTEQMVRWGQLPSIKSIYDTDLGALPKFNFPTAIEDNNHVPHARLYRYQTGSITCIPFFAGINADVDEYLGTIVDLSSNAYPEKPFRITVAK
jgi:hypothetical protein